MEYVMGSNKWFNLVIGIGWFVVALVLLTEGNSILSVTPLGIACLFF